MTTLPRCDLEIYNYGTTVFVGCDIRSEDMERWVKQVSERSEQRVDWHWFGGRAVVKALGDLRLVHAAINDLIEIYYKATGVDAPLFCYGNHGELKNVSAG